jgi:hypothetical protein
MPDVDTRSKRTYESLWETGVSPLLAGFGFFLLSTPDLLARFLPQIAPMQSGVGWLTICFVAAFAAVVIWGTRSISRNVLLLPIVLVPLVLVPLVLAYVISTFGRPATLIFLDSDRLVESGFAVVLATISLYEWRKRKSSLLLAYGIYLMCLALLIWWLPLSPTEPGDLLMAGAGGPLGVVGAMRLRAMLRASPAPTEARVA